MRIKWQLKIVLGGYNYSAEGDIESLSKLYHPECKIIINGIHALSGTYIGFQSFVENVLAKLDKVWPGFNLDIEKVVSNETDVCVFVNITAKIWIQSQYIILLLNMV